jgi:hypothetical protein
MAWASEVTTMRIIISRIIDQILIVYFTVVTGINCLILHINFIVKLR